MTREQPYDLLLEYLSAKELGSWEELKQAARAVAPDEESRTWMPTVVARNLTSLAHIEVAFGSDLRWTTCPPVLVTSSTLKQSQAFLCGRRTHNLMERVRTTADEQGVVVSEQSQSYAPTRVLLTGADEAGLTRFASSLNLPLVRNAAGRITQVLPTLGSMIAAAPAKSVPSGYDTSRFDPDTLTWRQVDNIGIEGSYQIDYFRPEFRIARAGTLIRVQRNVAMYHALALARRQVVRYSRQEQVLSIPATVQPPALYGRVLVLCNGLVPHYRQGTGNLLFAGVPEDVSTSISNKLRSLQE